MEARWPRISLSRPDEAHTPCRLVAMVLEQANARCKKGNMSCALVIWLGYAVEEANGALPEPLMAVDRVAVVGENFVVFG